MGHAQQGGGAGSHVRCKNGNTMEKGTSIDGTTDQVAYLIATFPMILSNVPDY